MQGIAKRVDNGYELRFERDLPYSAELVWTALTDSNKIGEWLGGEGSTIEPRLGGKVYMPQHGPIESTVTAFEPGRMIEFGWKSKDWDGGLIRWEIEPAGDGSHLVLTHYAPEIDPDVERKILAGHGLDPDEFPMVPRTLAGWHTLLDQLELTLKGDGEQLDEDHWRALFERYATASGS